MERVFVLVVFGTIFEFFATVVLYFGGYQFHPSYGFYGNPNATPLQCRKGWEWVPSVGWQFFWSWIVGPYMLWKVRKIKDTHYWKVQTVAAIIAGMPGTPLWLIFLYVWTPQTQVIQAWLIPAFWFLPCILVMQWTSIVCAVLDAKHTLERAESIAKESTASLAGSTSSQSSMRTLEMIIENDCEAFLNWVAEHDFTAECVLFLMRVRNFRRNWKAKSVNLRRSSSQVSVQSNNDRPRGLDIRDLYYEAAEIFFELVEPRTSEVPVNLSSRLINSLRLWFKDIECRGYPFSRPPSSTSSFSFIKPSNPATPFDDEAVSTQKTRYSDKTSLLIVPKEVNVEEVELANMSTEEICTAFNIPLGFGAEVFDAACGVVKEDVYRGAWPLYHAKVIGASVGAE
ncbi:hypothetical protein H2201_009047 [Coniosporium apollinis]|uniref:RGS domain-containing protein n=1 Tax=Coniosporium apollinis TaxID=61459 RepID=A0ABQ9NFD6_9PEZI|nr:hypothetical protein H2201_009047 [Coniosporium apollinis]